MTRLQPQLDVLAPRDADELAVEWLGAGALLGTGWVGTTGIRFELGPWDLRVRANRLQHGL